MNLYLCGPMTGLAEFNHPAFHAAAARLRSAGYHVTSPADNGLPVDAPWSDHMRRDIPQLLACDGVALLPGWEDSRGAKLERHIAIQIGITAIPLLAWTRIADQVRHTHRSA